MVESAVWWRLGGPRALSLWFPTHAANPWRVPGSGTLLICILKVSFSIEQTGLLASTLIEECPLHFVIPKATEQWPSWRLQISANSLAASFELLSQCQERDRSKLLTGPFLWRSIRVPQHPISSLIRFKYQGIQWLVSCRVHSYTRLRLSSWSIWLSQYWHSYVSNFNTKNPYRRVSDLPTWYCTYIHTWYLQ